MVFFLMFSNIGLALNVHYCGGQIDKVTLSYPHIDRDGKDCELEQKTVHNCCADRDTSLNEETCCEDQTLTQETSEKVVVKTLDISSHTAILTSPQSLEINFICEIILPKKEVIAFYCDSNAPPFYKLYNQFIFYA